MHVCQQHHHDDHKHTKKDDKKSLGEQIKVSTISASLAIIIVCYVFVAFVGNVAAMSFKADRTLYNFAFSV